MTESIRFPTLHYVPRWRVLCTKAGMGVTRDWQAVDPIAVQHDLPPPAAAVTATPIDEQLVVVAATTNLGIDNGHE